MNDAVEFRDDRKRAMDGRLRRQEGAGEDQGREQDSPHEKIMTDYRRVGVRRRVVRESESGDGLCASRSPVTACAPVRVGRRVVRESEYGDDPYQPIQFLPSPRWTVRRPRIPCESIAARPGVARRSLVVYRYGATHIDGFQESCRVR